jgi:Tol biopolymer transport system component
MSGVRFSLAKILVAVAGVAALGVCLPAIAAAEFGPIKLLSKSQFEQANYAGETAMSADGRYVVFCAELGGREGIFREEVSTGLIAPVVTTAVPQSEGCRPLVSYVWGPSISADGRYVSFTTKSQLVPSARPKTEAVYVADMDAFPPTYALASVNEAGEPLEGDSLAAGRVALSENGERVAFVNQGEVYVRELAPPGGTILISARREPLTGAMTSEPTPGGGAYQEAGASISGDGSTVAWVGDNLPEQVPMLADEEAAVRAIDAKAEEPKGHYFEPLWRRVPVIGGEDMPIRRMVGGGDPLAPGCPPSGTLSDPACQGPYPKSPSDREGAPPPEGFGWGLRLPQLSADGETAAVVGDPDEDYDLFIVDMKPGLDRREAVRQVTRWSKPNARLTNGEVLGKSPFFPTAGPIEDCAISPDGERVAFATTRQIFPPGALTLVTPRASGLAEIPELYQLDLETGLLERATPGGGEDVSLGSSKEGVSSPSYGADDHLIAFTSFAYNLVAGDGNQTSDAFLVESPSQPAPGTGSISARPPAPTLPPPSWQLTASAFSLPDGQVRVVARVPGQGRLQGRANAQLGSRLRTRRVARGHRRAVSARVVRLDLRLPPRLRPLMHRPGGLTATITLSFSGKGGRPLHALLSSRFHVHEKRSRKHRKGRR